jgi:hypothetical protein
MGRTRSASTAGVRVLIMVAFRLGFNRSYLNDQNEPIKIFMPTRKPSPAKTHSSFTPLGIIAAFIALAETVAGLAAVKTGGSVQLMFAAFACSFPILIAAIFFLILWKRSYVLYPPRDFDGGVDVRHFVDAMRHQAIGNQELQTLLRSTISETLGSQQTQLTLAQVSAEATPVKAGALKQVSESLIEQAVGRLQSAVITIDISAFRKSADADLVFPYDATEDAFGLLSAVYFQIDDFVPPYTYGKQWALQDIASDDYILPTEVDWKDNFALAESGATVHDLGLKPGAKLRAIPLNQRKR